MAARLDDMSLFSRFSALPLSAAPTGGGAGFLLSGCTGGGMVLLVPLMAATGLGMLVPPPGVLISALLGGMMRLVFDSERDSFSFELREVFEDDLDF